MSDGGLFEVVPGIYQVRGLDLSNMTLVEGDEGVLVIDPLISVETAEAALAQGVRVAPGHDYQPGLEGHVRVNIATSPARLEQVVEGLRTTLDPT